MKNTWTFNHKIYVRTIHDAQVCITSEDQLQQLTDPDSTQPTDKHDNSQPNDRHYNSKSTDRHDNPQKSDRPDISRMTDRVRDILLDSSDSGEFLGFPVTQQQNSTR